MFQDEDAAMREPREAMARRLTLQVLGHLRVSPRRLPLEVGPVRAVVQHLAQQNYMWGFAAVPRLKAPLRSNYFRTLATIDRPCIEDGIS